MYGKDFWQRVDIQRLCSWLADGGETTVTEPGTLEERYRRKQRLYCDAVQRACRNGDGERAAEDIYFEAGGLETISFEAGFLAGVRLGLEIGDKSR